MTENPKFLVERDPIDGCIIRYYGDSPEQSGLGIIMNEAELDAEVESTGNSDLRDALQALRDAKQTMKTRLDIVEPNF